MKSLIFTGILSIFLFSFVSAQEVEQITTEKKGLKTIYLQGGESIDSKQLSSILKSNPGSADTYKSSKIYGTVALSSIAAGTVFMGVGLYYSIKSAQEVGEGDLAGTTDYSNKSTNNILVGAGFYVFSVPFFLLSNSNLKKSINLYNASGSTGSLNDIDLYFGFTGEGIGVGLTF